MSSVGPKAPQTGLVDAGASFQQTELLIIGANGFIGKVLLALLLDRFPECERVHLLLRSKRRLSAQERLEKEILAAPPLTPIIERAGRQQICRRLVVHQGDLAQPRCGISEESLRQMEGRVRLIINCAGLVEFFPPVDDALATNVDGVARVIELARALNAGLVHVSTCFVCGEADGLVEESEQILGFYPRRRHSLDGAFHHERELRYMGERIREAYAAEGIQPGQRRTRMLTRRLIDLGWQRAAQWGWMNTYTYSKSLGEQLIAAQPDLPYTIVRPAIVEAALEFPFPGWVEGGRTAAPLVRMAMAGLRHWTVREDAPMEVIPVDLVASGMLIAAVMLLNGRARKVYHLSTAYENPIYYGPLIRILYKAYRRRQNGWRRWLRLPGAGVRVLTPEQAQQRGHRQQRLLEGAQEVTAKLRRWMQQLGIPGEDWVRRLNSSLRSASLRAMIRDQALQLYQPFMCDNRFIFEAENIRLAYRALSDRDRQRLPWTPEKIDWEAYWVNNEIPGVERWVAGQASALSD